MKVVSKNITNFIREELEAQFQAFALREHDAATWLERIEFEIESVDILSWVAGQPQAMKMYGADRDGQYEVAGVETADVLTGEQLVCVDQVLGSIRERLTQSHEKTKYYGAFTFDFEKKLDDLWKPFGHYFFLVPRFEIFRKLHKTFFACNFKKEEMVDKHAILEAFDHIHFGKKEETFSQTEVLVRQDNPSKEAWQASVLKAIQTFKETLLQKLVLSRSVELQLTKKLNPFSLLQALKEKSVASFDFCFQPDHNIAFVGSTPELLYARSGKKIASEAIAGTRPLGINSEEEASFEKDLKASAKDCQEHLVVFDSVYETLKQLCYDVHAVKKMDVLKLGYLQHLYSQFLGVLRDNVQDETLLNVLHPTPGVLGYPKKKAFQTLKQIEKHVRGWYAGPMGWVGKNEATFVVGIRSGLIENHTLTLFSGAGIMKDSNPENEWDEIENKIKPFLKIFG